MLFCKKGPVCMVLTKRKRKEKKRREGGKRNEKENNIFNLDIWFYINTPNKIQKVYFGDGQNWNFICH